RVGRDRFLGCRERCRGPPPAGEPPGSESPGLHRRRQTAVCPGRQGRGRPVGGGDRQGAAPVRPARDDSPDRGLFPGRGSTGVRPPLAVRADGPRRTAGPRRPLAGGHGEEGPRDHGHPGAGPGAAGLFPRRPHHRVRRQRRGPVAPGGRPPPAATGRRRRAFPFRTPPERAAWGSYTPEDLVAAMAFSPDGRLLALGWERAVYLWDAVTGAEVARFEGHAGKVAALAFAPDGKRL